MGCEMGLKLGGDLRFWNLVVEVHLLSVAMTVTQKQIEMGWNNGLLSDIQNLLSWNW